MKRIISLLLTLVIVLMVGSFSFAAAGDTDIPDQKVPGATVENVNSATYNQPSRTISGSTIDIQDETVPLALPSTGGIPSEAFYVVGALFIVAALILSKKKVKTAKN